MSKTVSKKRTKSTTADDENLWPSEVKAIKKYRAGKVRFKDFDNQKDMVKHLRS
jgi:hypothetical protein